MISLNVDSELGFISTQRTPQAGLTYYYLFKMAAEVAESGPGEYKLGSYTYEDDSHYVGEWSDRGQRHGAGQLTLPNGATYTGSFSNGFCSGLGVLTFGDGAKYEGEFSQGWFHGHGIFWRGDGMRYEGEFRGGRVWGYGLMTYSDGSHGFPREEGFFQDSKFVRKTKATGSINRAQKLALMARKLTV